MPKCDHCGRDVLKLLDHPFSKDKVCLKCMTRSGFFSRDLTGEIDPLPADHRKNVRIPVSIVMSFEIFDLEQQAYLTYQAYSVNLTVNGICFAWENCRQCLGYSERGVHEQCVFRPYTLGTPNARELELTFNITEKAKMQIPAYVVYTLKEKEMDIEYVGAAFASVNNEQRRILEIIIAKYGRLG